MTKFDTSYGIIPVRLQKKEWEVLLIEHCKKHWSFPKGHAEKGESHEMTAIRELFEETGLKVKKLLPFPSLKEHYFFTWQGEKIFKTVIYFLAEVEGEVTLQLSEVTDFCWLPLHEAKKKASYPESKRLCLEVERLLE